MDPKTWRWKKRSLDKSSFTVGNVKPSLERTDEERQMVQSDREVMTQRVEENLNDGVEQNYYTKKAQEEAIAGREKAEEEAALLRKELEEATEKLNHSDAALKEFMQQLEFIREEQEERIKDALMKASKGFQNAEKALEERLMGTAKKLEKMTEENFHLSKALLVAEKLVEDLHKHNSKSELEFNALMGRLCSTEEENNFLKYEFHVLEKELVMRNEEREYIRRSVDVAHKQHLETVKRNTTLEAECQRLRTVLRKKLPGGPADTRRRKMMNRTIVENSVNCTNTTNQNLLFEKLLRDVQEENKNLKDIVVKRNADLESLRLMSCRTTSISNQRSPMSCLDVASDDGVSSSESWASALISELEHFREGKLRRRVSQVSDISLMDDFVEMEKLAIVSVEETSGDKCHFGPTDEELVPVPVLPGHSKFRQVKEIQFESLKSEESFDWLQVVLKAILKQKCISNRGVDDLLHDIQIALGCKDQTKKSTEQSLCFKSVTSANRYDIEEENRKLKDEMKNMEASLESANFKNDELMVKLQESEQKIETLQAELSPLKESKEILEDRIENQMETNEDLDTQLTVSKAKLSELFQKFSSLEVELEYRNNCCQELEGTCLELQLQLESVAKKEQPIYTTDQEMKQSKHNLELTVASQKLAECQETILNLGKQLKVMSKPHVAAQTEKFFSSTGALIPTSNKKKFSKRLSLRDQLQAEYGFKADNSRSPNNKNTLCNKVNKELSLLSSGNRSALVVYTPSNEYPVSKNVANGVSGANLAIVPSKKRGLGFLRKLLLTRKKASCKRSISIRL